MKVSDLFAEVEAAGEVLSYVVYLAAPDKDGTDVDLASVGRVELDYAQGVARLYPAEIASDSDADSESTEPEPFLGLVLSQLPTDSAGDNDLQLLVEIPLLRDETDDAQVSLVELAGIQIGKASEEAWLLVRPAEEFAAGLLPT